MMMMMKMFGRLGATLALAALLAFPAAADQPWSAPGSNSSATVGTAAVQLLGQAGSRVHLAIDNEGAAPVGVCFGAPCVPSIGAAGTWTIPPGWTRSWDGNFVPSDAVQAIAGAAGTPVNIEAW